MSYKHIYRINAKSLADIKAPNRRKLLPLVEKETLDWAKAHEPDAFQMTAEVKEELATGAANENKYFKYLRRLLELKYQQHEKFREKNPELEPIIISNDLKDWLNIEVLRKPNYLSCTQIGMYEFCPRKWYYRYALGIKTPKTSALHFGSAIDEALNFYFEGKIKGSIPPESALSACFEENFAKDYDSVVWGEDDPEVLRKRGPLVIKTYLENFDSITNAVDIQTEITVPLDNGGYITGFIDILESEAIVDTKTAKKFWETTGLYAKHTKELQPKAYSLWYYIDKGKMPKEFRYQIVTKDEKPQTQLIRFEVKKFEVETFHRKVQMMWDDINAALKMGKASFPAQAEVGPNPGRGLGCKEPDVLCCKEYCDFWQLCEKDGLRIPAKWVKKTKTTKGHHIYD